MSGAGPGRGTERGYGGYAGDGTLWVARKHGGRGNPRSGPDPEGPLAPGGARGGRTRRSVPPGPAGQLRERGSAAPCLERGRRSRDPRAARPRRPSAAAGGTCPHPGASSSDSLPQPSLAVLRLCPAGLCQPFPVPRRQDLPRNLRPLGGSLPSELCLPQPFQQSLLPQCVSPLSRGSFQVYKGSMSLSRPGTAGPRRNVS